MSIKAERYSMLPAVLEKKKVKPKTFKKMKKPESGFIKKGLKFAGKGLFLAATSPLGLGITAATVGIRGIREAGKKVTQNRPLRRSMDKRGRFLL